MTTARRPPAPLAVATLSPAPTPARACVRTSLPTEASRVVEAAARRAWRRILVLQPTEPTQSVPLPPIPPTTPRLHLVTRPNHRLLLSLLLPPPKRRFPAPQCRLPRASQLFQRRPLPLPPVPRPVRPPGARRVRLRAKHPANPARRCASER
ncbi:hypothetical protein C8R43DRAFT_566856 [Mycena crocata]|nr:hypothetical protein C8R43DRAFT_566856 [Mycena crocata]